MTIQLETKYIQTKNKKNIVKPIFILKNIKNNCKTNKFKQNIKKIIVKPINSNKKHKKHCKTNIYVKNY